jgi:hypothetical protein
MSNKIGQSSGAPPPPLYATEENGRTYASGLDRMTGLFNIFAESAIKGRSDEGELKTQLIVPKYNEDVQAESSRNSVNPAPNKERSDPSPNSPEKETVPQSKFQDNPIPQSEIPQPEPAQEPEYVQYAMDQEQQQPDASQQPERSDVREFSEEGAQEAAREAAQEAAEEQIHIARDFAPHELQAQTNGNQRSNPSLLFSPTQNNIAQNTNPNAPLQSGSASNPSIREEVSFKGSSAKNSQLSTPHAMTASSKQPSQMQPGPALAANNKGSANPPLSLPSSSNTLQTLIAEGKLTSWAAVRNYFGQMAQTMVSLQSQNLPHAELTPAHFLLNPQGNVQLAFPGMPTFGTGSAGLMPSSSLANGQKGDAFNAGLILLQMCTGKQIDAINPATNKTFRQEIVEGRLQLPSHIPEDLKQVLSGLLQLHSQEQHSQLAKVPSLLQPLPQSKPSESAQVPTPLAHLKGGEMARPAAGAIQEEPLVSSLPITTSTLFVNSSPTAKSQVPAKNSDEEEQEENAPSIQVVVFGSEEISNEMDEEMLALLEALKSKKTRVALLSEKGQEQGEDAPLFDLYLLSRKIQLGRPYLQGYDALIKVIDVPAKEILFIDRNPERVKNAKIVGMDALVFTSPKQLRDALSKRDLLDQS